MNFKPLLDWLVVKLDPIPEKQGSIIMVHGGRIRTARVLAVGPGRFTSEGNRIVPDVHPGEKVVFFREHLEHQQGKALLHSLEDLGEDLGLLREPDILFVIPEGENAVVEACG